MRGNSLSHRRLRTWIRLLRLTRHTENTLRDYMRVSHGTTLPRFDVMAALYRSDGPMKMSALSQMLLVSNGNASTVVDRLEKDGLVTRVPAQDDRRVVNVSLSDRGRAQFEELAAGHAALVDRLFAGLDDHDLDQIRDLLHRAEAGARQES
ncbi:MarR family transcriptional regulator (plasmid) [Sulfitobacter alexandrii]|uniref:MarR family transcriptional regulator n=1 Tax=Sulfitobacter alexandrii TaxID=1917485 RepID=A0A1J0WN77_9RHOB|nr:MarR family transcriptional regulator [Sulfitobacter alexandrii]APE45699.1 MarR family transcriptional regulator [Sulfitobacter alexandrii]